MIERDAGRTYPEPAIDRAQASAGLWRVLVVAAGLVGAAVSLALFAPADADIFVLGFLALLAVVGVFGLFAAAIGIIRFSSARAEPSLPRSVVDAAPEGIVVTDASGRLLYANRAYMSLVGAEDEVNLPGVERAFSRDAEAAEVVYRLAQAAREGRRLQEEMRLAERPDGRAGAGWYRVRVSPLPSPGGRNGPAAWTISEISADRDRQEDIFQELQQAIDYLDHAPAGFLSAEPGGRISYVNATLAEWLGYDLAELTVKPLDLAGIVSGDGTALIEGAKGSAGAVRTETLDIDLVRKNGQNLPVRLLHKVAFSAEGEAGPSRTLVLNRSAGSDVSDPLRAMEVRFARFFNKAPIAIATVDRAGNVIRANAVFARLFGAVHKAEEGGEGRSVVQLVATRDRPQFDAALAAAAEGRSEIKPVDLQLGEEVGRNGRFYVSAVEDGETGQEAAIVFAIDTTEQRALELQFAQSQKMQAIGQLAGGVAHDFNNVLTAIIGYSDLLLVNHRPTDPSFQDIMNIKQNANRAAGLVRQLLAFSRRQTLRPQVLALGEVLADVSILLKRLIGETIELDVLHGRDLWFVKADINQFEQVVVNLAVNARDAMGAGGKLTIRTANVSAAEAATFDYPGMPAAEYVLCEVSDSGTGIPPDIIDKIFEPFFSTKEVGKGTGLGLSTVYGIVKQTGGYVFVDSRTGEGGENGTTFRIFLPRHIPKEDAKEAPKKEARADSDLTGAGTVLLVEDEDAVRAFACRALASRGYTVLEAPTGARALELMMENSGKVDLVVSDVVMPEMDGPTLLKELRKRQPDLKIIFVSGYAEEAFRKNLADDEQFVFLPKPFSLKQLAQAVKDTLAG